MSESALMVSSSIIASGIADPTAEMVTAVVVSYNARDYLRRTLRCLGEQTWVNLEIIVVDNASSDGSALMVKDEFPDVRLIEQENRGLSGGANAGMFASSGAFVCSMNEDLEFDRDALHRMAKYLVQHPRVGAIGPRLRNTDGSLQPTGHPHLSPLSLVRARYRAFLTGRQTYIEDGRDYSVSCAVGTVPGACIMVRREVLVATQGYDDANFFVNWEDEDWCARIRALGYEVHYVADATALHHWGASTASNSVSVGESGRTGLLRYLRKHHGAVSALAVQYAFLPLDLASVAKAALRSLGLRRDRTALRKVWRVLVVTWDGSGRLAPHQR